MRTGGAGGALRTGGARGAFRSGGALRTGGAGGAFRTGGASGASSAREPLSHQTPLSVNLHRHLDAAFSDAGKEGHGEKTRRP